MRESPVRLKQRLILSETFRNMKLNRSKGFIIIIIIITNARYNMTDLAEYCGGVERTIYMLRAADRYAYTGSGSTAYCYLFYLGDEQILIHIGKCCRSSA
jgi:hypothetical protein